MKHFTCSLWTFAFITDNFRNRFFSLFHLLSEVIKFIALRHSMGPEEWSILNFPIIIIAVVTIRSKFHSSIGRERREKIFVEICSKSSCLLFELLSSLKANAKKVPNRQRKQYGDFQITSCVYFTTMMVTKYTENDSKIPVGGEVEKVIWTTNSLRLLFLWYITQVNRAWILFGRILPSLSIPTTSFESLLLSFQLISLVKFAFLLNGISHRFLFYNLRSFSFEKWKKRDKSIHLHPNSSCKHFSIIIPKF